MKHFPVPVNGAVRPVDASIALPARPPKHRRSRKKELALLAADIRHGIVPAQSTLARAFGISVAMVSAAENLTPAARASLRHASENRHSEKPRLRGHPGPVFPPIARGMRNCATPSVWTEREQ
jgi:hypothetical protein